MRLPCCRYNARTMALTAERLQEIATELATGPGHERGCPSGRCECLRLERPQFADKVAQLLGGDADGDVGVLRRAKQFLPHCPTPSLVNSSPCLVGGIDHRSEGLRN